MKPDPWAEAEERRSESAAYWHLHLSGPRIDPETMSGFRAWLAEEPANVRAFEQTREAMAFVDAEAAAPELIGLRRASLQLAEGSGPEVAEARSWRGFFMGAAVAAVLCLCLTTAVLLQLDRPMSQTYYTAAAERRIVTLADGSRMAMDEGTTVSVLLTGRRREITLLGGQARFQVAHDHERPFTVGASGYSVLATGTDFNVERPSGRAIVTLLEGRVTVSQIPPSSGLLDYLPGRPAAASIDLVPGNQLDTGIGGRAVLRRQVTAYDALAWQSGKLSFNNEPLSSALNRFNRYRGRRIMIGDPSIERLRVNGVFNIDNSEGFVEALPLLLPIRVEHRADGVIILRGKQPAAVI